MTLPTTPTPQLTPGALGMIADFFKVLSEVSRLEIVCALKNGPSVSVKLSKVRAWARLMSLNTSSC